MYRWKRFNNKAFTLLELLIVLVLTSFILQSISMVYQTYQKIEEAHQKDYRGHFNLFVAILESELSYYTDFNVKENRLYMQAKEDSSQSVYIEAHTNHKIVKSPGHQILLFDVLDWEIDLYEDFLFVTVYFLNQESYFSCLKLHR